MALGKHLLFGGPRTWGQRAELCGGCVAEKSYAQLVFMSTSAGSLWNLHAIHSMCRMEQDQVSRLGRCQGLGGNQGHRRPGPKEIQLSQDCQDRLGKSIPCLENYSNPAERLKVGVGKEESAVFRRSKISVKRQTTQSLGVS